MKVAIICRPDNKSPKVLALSLKSMLKHQNIDAEIIFDVSFLRRLVPFFDSSSRNKASFHFKLRRRIENVLKDYRIIKKLKSFDAIILSECIPNAYWKDYYGISELRKRIGKPIGLYEVFFLNASPRFLKEIKQDNRDYLKYFDFEFAISRVSYTKDLEETKKYEVGLDLASRGIKPTEKKELVALIDFYWEGCEDIRKNQIEALKKVGIKIIELKGKYTIEEIRALYAEASLFFIQHFESFGLPIAECLGYGNKIVTPNSGWPMAFRKGEDLKEYGPGILPECFMVYKDEQDLILRLEDYKRTFDGLNTPLNNFDIFLSHYPHFYKGASNEILRFKNEN